MSEENVELGRRFVDALNAFMRGEVPSEAWLAFWDEEGEFYPMRAQLEGESYSGHDGLLRFVAELAEDFEDVRFEVEETRDAGEQMVGIGRFRARGRASRVDLNVPYGAVQRVRRGRLSTRACSRTQQRPSKPPGCRADVGRERRKTSRPLRDMGDTRQEHVG